MEYIVEQSSHECRKKYKTMRKLHHNYVDKNARDRFVDYFTALFLQKANPGRQSDLIKKIRAGENTPAKETSELVAELMEKVYSDIRDQCRSKKGKRYAKKYRDRLQKVTDDLVRAIYGLVPEKAHATLHAKIVPNQLDENTAITRERFKEFIQEVRDKRTPKARNFKAEDVTKIIDIMVDILVNALDCDADVVRPLTFIILEAAVNADKFQEITAKHGKELRQLCSKKKDPPDIKKLETLLHFIITTFPNGRQTVELERGDSIKNLLERAKNPEVLDSLYTYFKELISKFALTNESKLLVRVNLVDFVQRVWSSLQVSVLKSKSPPSLSNDNMEQFFSDLLQHINQAAENLKEYVNNNCNSRWRPRWSEKKWRVVDWDPTADCVYVLEDVKKLQKLAEEIANHVADTTFDKFKNQFQDLAKSRIFTTIEDKINEDDRYKRLKQMVSLERRNRAR